MVVCVVISHSTLIADTATLSLFVRREIVSKEVAEWLCDVGVPLKGWEWTML